MLRCDPGFYFLFKNYSGHTKSAFATPAETFIILFDMTLGEYKVNYAHLLLYLLRLSLWC